MAVEFIITSDDAIYSECGRYVVIKGFSTAYGCAVYRACRASDERDWNLVLGEFFKLPYAIDACERDAEAPCVGEVRAKTSMVGTGSP